MSESDLILGKYENVGALENAYKSLKGKYDDLAIEKNKYIVPENYDISEELKLVSDDILKSSKDHAKKYGFTQKQFDQLVNDKVESHKKHIEEKNKKYAGIEDIDNLKEYAKSDMGFSDSVINNMEKIDFENIRKMRNSSLEMDNNVSSSQAIINEVVTDKKVHEAFLQIEEARRSSDNISVQRAIENYKKLTDKLRGNSENT